MNHFYKIALVIPALLLGGCSKHKHKDKTPTKVIEQAARNEVKAAKGNLSGLKGAVMRGGELEGGDSQGRPLWKVVADEIRSSGSLADGAPKQAVLTNAHATLFQDGKPETHLNSKQIMLYNTPKGVRLQMTQGVTGQTQGPWTKAHGPVNIAAPRADVDVQNRLIAASGGVVMTQGMLRVVGQTLRAQTSLQVATMNTKVRATNGDGIMLANTATYDWQHDKLKAQTVTATRQGTVLTGDRLDADNNVSKGTLTGHVTAHSPQGNATAPSADFDWKGDHITAPDATMIGQDGTMHAKILHTDSKLTIASANDLTAVKDEATMRADFADGFNGLTHLHGKGVTYTRGDLTFSAPVAEAVRHGSNWVMVASQGGNAKNASGTAKASHLTWDEGANTVRGSGDVEFTKQGSTLYGDAFTSDTKFNNAVLTGHVHGQMQDGSTLQAGLLQKRGDKLFASNGATAHMKSKGSQGPLTVKAPKIEAASDGSTAVATGGVTVTNVTNATAHAPRAVYDRKSNTLTATGGVDFHDPVRGLRQHGDTMVADLAMKQAKLSNVNGQGETKLFEGKKLF